MQRTVGTVFHLGINIDNFSSSLVTPPHKGSAEEKNLGFEVFWEEDKIYYIHCSIWELNFESERA